MYVLNKQKVVRNLTIIGLVVLMYLLMGSKLIKEAYAFSKPIATKEASIKYWNEQLRDSE